MLPNERFLFHSDSCHNAAMLAERAGDFALAYRLREEAWAWRKLATRAARWRMA